MKLWNWIKKKLRRTRDEGVYAPETILRLQEIVDETNQQLVGFRNSLYAELNNNQKGTNMEDTFKTEVIEVGSRNARAGDFAVVEYENGDIQAGYLMSSYVLGERGLTLNGISTFISISTSTTHEPRWFPNPCVRRVRRISRVVRVKVKPETKPLPTIPGYYIVSGYSQSCIYKREDNGLWMNVETGDDYSGEYIESLTPDHTFTRLIPEDKIKTGFVVSESKKLTFYYDDDLRGAW